MRPRDLFRLCFLHPVIKYATALVATLAAVLIRYELQSVFHDQSRYLLILPVMMVWAIYAGLGPGLLIAIVGSLLTVVLIIPPFGSLKMSVTDANAFTVHFLMCAGILWLVEREVRERRRREETEREMEQLNQALEAKVAARTSQLALANSDLEGFCYSMAHDLRTPSRAIAGNARILLEDHAESLTPELRNHLVRMNGAANKLGSLIDALLLYARLAQQDLQPVDIDVVALVRDVARMDPGAAHIELGLELEDGLRLYADERQMRVLVSELVKNAIVYRKPDGPVHLRVGMDGDSLVFADDGIGFDTAYRAKVFLPFERLHRDEQYPGIGMGLASVARVVNRHGGEAFIESEPGKGTSVRLVIPGLKKRSRELAGARSGVR